MPVDYVFYNALAAKLDGKKDDALAVFESMKKWSYDAFNDEVKEDFFAVSLPDLVVLDGDLNKSRKENCLLMRMLSAVGLNDRNLFEQSFAELENLNPSNFKLALYRELSETLFTLSASDEI